MNAAVAAPTVQRLADALSALTPAPVSAVRQAGEDVVLEIAANESQIERMMALMARLERQDVAALGVRASVRRSLAPWRMALDVQVDRARVEELTEVLTRGWLYPLMLSEHGLLVFAGLDPALAANPRLQLGYGVAGLALLTSAEVAVLERELAARPPLQGDAGRVERMVCARRGLDEIEEALRLARRSPVERPS